MHAARHSRGSTASFDTGSWTAHGRIGERSQGSSCRGNEDGRLNALWQLRRWQLSGSGARFAQLQPLELANAHGLLFDWAFEFAPCLTCMIDGKQQSGSLIEIMATTSSHALHVPSARQRISRMIKPGQVSKMTSSGCTRCSSHGCSFVASNFTTSLPCGMAMVRFRW